MLEKTEEFVIIEWDGRGTVIELQGLRMTIRQYC